MLDDTNVNNFEYSILAGPAMLFISALSSMPLSRLSDYTMYPKKFLLVCSCLAAMITACNSFATNFYTLLWPRLLFSVISSPISPLNLRIMASYFDMKKRGLASGAYFLTIYIGLASYFVRILRMTINLPLLRRSLFVYNFDVWAKLRKDSKYSAKVKY